MRKKMKKALGVILGATVMMAVAGCGQSNSSGGQSTQEAKRNLQKQRKQKQKKVSRKRKQPELSKCGLC